MAESWPSQRRPEQPAGDGEGALAPRGADRAGPHSRVAPAERAPSMATFLHECNSHRANADRIVVAMAAVVVSHGTLKYWAILPTSAHVYTACLLTWHAIILTWSTLLPASYRRWRELVASSLRLDPIFNSISPHGFLEMAQLLRQSAPGELSCWRFISCLVFLSDAPRLAIVGFGLPLRAFAHLPYQLVLALLAWRQNAPLCEAIVGPSGPLSAAQGVAAAAPAVTEAGGATAAIAFWHRSFYMLAAVLPLQAGAPAPKLDPVQQCRCVMGFLQMTGGLVVPAVAHLILESRAYCLHSRQAARERGRQQVGTGAGPDANGGGPEGLGPRLARGIYVWVWGQVSHLGLFMGAWMGMSLLAMVWSAVVAAVAWIGPGAVQP